MARLRLVDVSVTEQTIIERIEGVLADGVPRTYYELGDILNEDYQKIYLAVFHAKESGRTSLMTRSFARSNRHYVFPKKFATKLGSVWNTEMVNKPITFAILLQLGGKLK